MPVFIELTTDAFASVFNQQEGGGEVDRHPGATRARRPLRGLEIKDDTYAIMKVVRADGTEIPLIDSGSPTGRSTQYANFLLQSVQEARMEKHQIIETFGEPYIFFFGESPRFLDVTAVLIDSHDFNWYAEFWKNYELYFRGTKLVEMGARTYLFYEDNVVEGYMLMAQARKVSDQPLMAQLTFRLYLTNYQNVTFVGGPNFPVRSSVNLPPDVSLTSADLTGVGIAAFNAVNEATLNESRALQAQLGAQQQAGGFGGAQNLSDALRGGVTSVGDPYTDGVMTNALEAILGIGGDQVRVKPLRSLIADNVDEFTAFLPPPPAASGQDQPDQDGQPEAYDLPVAAVRQAGKHGANINNPTLLARLGLGPNFTARAGFGLNGSAGASASFGVSAGFSAGFRGGINGGLGFSGGFTASANLGVTAGIAASAGPVSNFGSQRSVYGNGVPVQGGIIQGTGVGGGIPGGMMGGIGPGGPGTLPQYSGGQAWASVNGFGSMQGYGNGLSANGASLNVGGAPSAFATISAPGTLNYGGSIQETFYIGPNGVSSYENRTGVFA